MKISRRAYTDLYGPTTGDRVRLGDTALVLQIERDAARYGEEVVFGGGKVIRDGQGQSQASRADGAPDLVITNAIIIDHWGIVKADVGVRDGRICAIGKAGNPDVQDGVTPGLEIAASTEIIAGEHRILTAGGIDSHIHFISPQQAWEALSQRCHHDDRRRNRAGGGHARDDLHAGRMEHPSHAGGRGRSAAELRLPGQGERVPPQDHWSSRSWRAPSASSSTRIGERRRPRSIRP